MKAFQCDLTQDELMDHILEDKLDIILLFFVLSAITPDKMTSVVTNIYKVYSSWKCCVTLETRSLDM